MLRNYITTALRNLVRNRLYAAINIVGLAVGFAAALLIALFVRDELTYERWIPGYERTLLLTHTIRFGGVLRYDKSWSELASRLKLEFSEVESATRIVDEKVSLRVGDIEANEKIYWADANVFDVLPLPTIHGEARGALERPDSVVLTARIAEKYFGSVGVVGRTIELNRAHPLVVTAVLKDLPSNTHFDTDILVSGQSTFSRLAERDALIPNRNNLVETYTFVRLMPGAPIRAFGERLQEFAERAFNGLPNSPTVSALPIEQMHLTPGRVPLSLMKLTGSVEAIRNVSLIAVLIIVLAGINFVNLMTARALRRGIEVGVRKVSGATRAHLIVQFLGEAFVYVLVSAGAALLFAALFLSKLNIILDKAISFSDLRESLAVLTIFGACAVIGLTAGAYPAFILSAFRSVSALRLGVVGASGGKQPLRLALVTIQFAILLLLCTAVAVVYTQLRFALESGLRFDKDQALFIEAPCKGAFKEALSSVQGISTVACSSNSALAFGNEIVALELPDQPPLRLSLAMTGTGFFDLYGLHPLAGRTFNDDMQDALQENGTAPILLNERAVRALGYPTPEAALGQSRRLLPGREGFQTIVGVVPDFALDTVGRVILPTLFYLDSKRFNRINVKLSGQGAPETLKAIDNLWKRVGEPRPIERTFVDQQLETRHRQLIQQTEMVGTLAVTAIVIAILGLFGLASFAAEQRTKEIGIRKAMGAREVEILRLILWQFTKPVLLANVLAWPVAYFLM